MSEWPEGRYHKGGIVSGDDIPATIRLRAGDYILTAEQATRAGLDYIKRTYGDNAEDVD